MTMFVFSVWLLCYTLTMLIRETHSVLREDLGKRLEEFCFNRFLHLTTRKGTKKAIKRKQLLVNGENQCGSYFVREDDIISLIEPTESIPFKIFPLKLTVLYEDDFLAVVNKPPGYPVSGNYYKTIEHALPYNITTSSASDALCFPLPCHRLDRATSGCLIIAKTYSARVYLGNLFENGAINKEYTALVVGGGTIPDQVTLPIEGKPSHSIILVKRQVPSLSNDQVTMVELSPITGRTHQLRIHCAASGFPILGDPLYGTPKSRLKGKGLFLCSTSVSFVHPETGRKIEVSCPIPTKFHTFLEREKKRYLLHQNSAI